MNMERYKSQKMKPTTVLVLSLLSLTSFGQFPEVLDYRSIKINGVSWGASESVLIGIFGTPDTVFDPQYDCGAYSTDWQDIENVRLFRYPGIDFLLVDGAVVFLDMYFNNNVGLKLSWEAGALSGKTTIEELKELFPVAYDSWLNTGQGVFRLLTCEACDSEVWLHIENGQVKRVQFWESC